MEEMVKMYLMKECPYCSCKSFTKVYEDEDIYECNDCGEESEEWQLALVEVQDLTDLDN